MKGFSLSAVRSLRNATPEGIAAAETSMNSKFTSLKENTQKFKMYMYTTYIKTQLLFSVKDFLYISVYIVSRKQHLKIWISKFKGSAGFWSIVYCILPLVFKHVKLTMEDYKCSYTFNEPATLMLNFRYWFDLSG